MIKYLALLISVASLTSCNSNAVYEQNIAIENRAWTYQQKPSFVVKVDDAHAKYDLLINLRHTAGYDYSNIFILLTEQGKGLKDSTSRKEIPLSALDGQWYGKSAGSLYDVEYLAKQNFSFPDTGAYTFRIEQNMRDNPLKDVSDIGIKLIKK